MDRMWTVKHLSSVHSPRMRGRRKRRGVEKRRKLKGGEKQMDSGEVMREEKERGRGRIRNKDGSDRRRYET